MKTATYFVILIITVKISYNLKFGISINGHYNSKSKIVKCVPKRYYPNAVLLKKYDVLNRFIHLWI